MRRRRRRKKEEEEEEKEEEEEEKEEEEEEGRSRGACVHRSRRSMALTGDWVWLPYSSGLVSLSVPPIDAFSVEIQILQMPA